MISIDDLRTHLRIPEYDYYEDAYIEALEVSAVAAIEDWTRRYFGPAEETPDPEVYDGPGTDTIWLDEIADTGETVLVEQWNGSSWDEVDSGDYEIDGFGLYHRTSVWPYGRRNVRVTYTRGYAPGEEPAAIRQAVLLLVAHWWQNREPVGLGMVEIPFTVKSLIAPFRTVKV